MMCAVNCVGVFVLEDKDPVCKISEIFIFKIND